MPHIIFPLALLVTRVVKYVVQKHNIKAYTFSLHNVTGKQALENLAKRIKFTEISFTNMFRLLSSFMKYSKYTILEVDKVVRP